VERGTDAPGTPRADQVIGRDDLLTRAREHLGEGGSLLLYGPAGIGKSTLLRTLAAEQSGEGVTVLRCSPTESESHLPFLALVDLLGLVASEVSHTLPVPQRAALESALTGRSESPEQRDGLALRLAVLSVLRTLAARGPVLVVADELQWMDPASAELLAFAARRTGGLPLLLLGAVRTETDPKDPDDQHDRFRRLFPEGTLTLRVPPLSMLQVEQLLARHGHSGLTRTVLREIHRTSGGNPLFALELGRALAESRTPPRPGEPLPVPTSLRTLVLNRLGMLSADTRRTLLIASAGARPTVAVLSGAGRPNAAAETAVAASLGLVETDRDGVIRFSHPLISAALYAEALPEDRRTAHAALAHVVSDTIERARHLALATPGKDALVATELTAAAAEARDRGAPGVAAQLGVSAARHTPDGPGGPDGEHRQARLLDAAEDALTAGDMELARSIAYEALEDARRPADRVRAWMVVINSTGQAFGEAGHAFPQALADAGDDPRLLGVVRYHLAWRALLTEGSLVRAREEAKQAAELAARAGDRSTELLALAFQAINEEHMGHPDAARTLARSLREPRLPEVDCDHNGPLYTKFSFLLLGDELDEARTTISALVRTARQRGAVESEVAYLRGLADTELRSGRCAHALELAYECLGLAQDSGIGETPALQIASLAEAAGGSAGRALPLARDAVRRAEEDGDQAYLARTYYALGHAHLARGDGLAAAAALRRARDLEHDLGVTDPARGRWQGDLAEALVMLGELDEAAEVVASTREAAERHGRRSTLAVLDRAEALIVLARAERDGAPGAAGAGARAATALRVAALDPAAGERAAGLLAGARKRLGALGYLLEEGRTVQALARLEERRGDPAAASAALREAAQIFRRAQALPWLERLDSASRAARPDMPELGRLATMERQVVDRVLEGATNREIAASLFISVKTVEATLTRVYRKLGIRSRVDIVRLAARRQAG
jgi:DNA-binding CsgD family transcriptional regulator